MQGHYDSLSQALEDLRARGFTATFGLKKDHIVCFEEKHGIAPADFVIEESYRFEGATDPYDSVAVYAIRSEKYQLAGVLVHAYGTSNEELTAELSEKFENSAETT